MCCAHTLHCAHTVHCVHTTIYCATQYVAPSAHTICRATQYVATTQDIAPTQYVTPTQYVEPHSTLRPYYMSRHTVCCAHTGRCTCISSPNKFVTNITKRQLVYELHDKWLIIIVGQLKPVIRIDGKHIPKILLAFSIANMPRLCLGCCHLLPCTPLVHLIQEVSGHPFHLV